MAYHKRDYLYFKNDTWNTILIKNQTPLELPADSDPISFSHDHLMPSEFIDLACDTFYAMQDLSESQGVPVLQLCRFPNFVDFIKKITKT